ncbi:hypothetical protein [Nguyenibacter sp. L1]|uniref:hypothetical protein n=1 Tax=Nguyenibacter sp. L1 TaxID=3049350 RepID=UPI002B49F3F2|nr:hypothetical protein [Nguyenibacter sp. L1]WRH86754.1 hypothetical protein QN315_12110 [Nguyenibacter sp. L1]
MKNVDKSDLIAGIKAIADHRDMADLEFIAEALNVTFSDPIESTATMRRGAEKLYCERFIGKAIEAKRYPIYVRYSRIYGKIKTTPLKQASLVISPDSSVFSLTAQDLIDSLNAPTGEISVGMVNPIDTIEWKFNPLSHAYEFYLHCSYLRNTNLVTTLFFTQDFL